MKINLTTIDHIKNPKIQYHIELLKEKKRSASNNDDAETANNCWRELEALKLNILFIKAFHNIKLKNYRQAWNELEQCEIKDTFIRENSPPEYMVSSRLDFIKDKVSKWQSLYPYCMFCSPGFKVGYYSCSICGHKIRPRSRCEHKKGKVYSGKLCLHKAHDLEILEISIVTKPVQKYSVMHDDSTLDFTILDQLASFLAHAFEDWDLKWTKMKFPIERFDSIYKEDECPCKSNKTYEACCLGKREIEIPHIDFLLSKPLPIDTRTFTFPYDKG
ncbi:hypothetical protein [Acinetobacter modestus]|uniref:hypothetical protein n=1 Tax=Acinetobacter modestus TaxID=1776740 RepID=UPI00301752BB